MNTTQLGAQQLKSARRQAYRYGRQLTLMLSNAHDAAHVSNAWNAFIGQFTDPDATDTVVPYLTNAYRDGIHGDESMDEAMGFTINTSEVRTYTELRSTDDE